MIAVVALAGCGGSSGPNVPTVAPAKVYRLVRTEPAAPVPPGRRVLAFTVEQPSGQPLTSYRTGAGPHTGVHVIVVKDDLSTILHRHPPVGSDGRVRQAFELASPGRYRVLADVYPKLSASLLRNFQLTYDIRVSGRERTRPLPPFRPVVTVDGYRVAIEGNPKLRAIRAGFLRVHVTDPQGRPAVFEPYYGALAHAIFFHEGNLGYFHTHICGPRTPGCTSVLGGARVTGTSTKAGLLRTGVLLPEGGRWRLFLQFKSQGKVLTAPFTLDVGSP